MKARAIRINCDTIARKERYELTISGDKKTLCLQFGKKDRDIFLVDFEEFIQCLHILGILE